MRPENRSGETSEAMTMYAQLLSGVSTGEWRHAELRQVILPVAPLVRGLDDLRRSVPYRESDHVLSIAYNVIRHAVVARVSHVMSPGGFERSLKTSCLLAAEWHRRFSICDTRHKPADRAALQA